MPLQSLPTVGGADAIKPPDIPDPFDLAKGANANALMGAQILHQQQQNQLQAQTLQSANLLKTIAARPGSFNPDGSPTNALVAAVAGTGDMNAVNALVTHASIVEKNKAQAEERRQKAAIEHDRLMAEDGKEIDRAMGDILHLNERYKAMPDDQRMQLLNAEWAKRREDWAKTGGISPARLAQASPVVDLDKFAAFSNSYRDWQLKNQKETDKGDQLWIGPKGERINVNKFSGKAQYFDLPTQKWVDWNGSLQGFVPSNQPTIEVTAGRAGAVAAEKARVGAELTDQQKVGDDTKTGQAYIDTLPPAQQKVTQAIVQGAVPLQSFSTRKYQGGKTDRDIQREHAMQADPTFTDNRYPMFQEFTKGQQGRNLVSLNTSIAHLGTLADATVAMKNGDVQIANKLFNTVLTQLGKPEQPTLDTARIAVGSELMRTFRGVGAGSEKEIEEWRRNWDAAKSPAQYEATLKEAGELLGGRAFALNETWKSGTRMSTDFPNIIQPQSRSVLRRLGAKSDFVKLGMPRVTNDAEFNTLPSGAEFTDPNGVVRKKP